VNLRPLLTWLVAAALALPIVALLLVATSQLLAGMQDTGGALVLARLALATGLLWVAALAGLVIVLALDRLGPPPPPPPRHDEILDQTPE
ncbi:MAG TPA: hypothetical protein VG433_09145, partial [Pirellulales bacterium]|nr:hypothetical protein [Pirellulales bacterium]